MARTKCKLGKNGHLQMCVALGKTVQEKRGGVNAELQMDLNGKAIRTIVVIRSGQFTKNGIVMNHCPFCSEIVYREDQDAKAQKLRQ